MQCSAVGVAAGGFALAVCRSGWRLCARIQVTAGGFALAQRGKATTNRSDEDRHGWGLCHFDGSRVAIAAFLWAGVKLLSQSAVEGTWLDVNGVDDGT